MFFIIGILLFSIPATIIAAKKGFAPLRWMLSLGIIGLGFVLYLPAANAADITPDEAQRRGDKADKWGALLAWINAGLDVIGLAFSCWVMVSNDVWEQGAIPIVFLAILYAAAERIIAFRWLLADSNARQAPFSLWAFLTLVFPVLGIGLYLKFRPKNPDVPSWRLPPEAAMPLAVIAALIMTSASSSIGHYYFRLHMSMMGLGMTMKILFAAAIALAAWFLTKKQAASWQNNPLILLSGLLLSLAPIFFRLTGMSSYVDFMLVTLVFALSLASVISALLHLTREFRLVGILRGLVVGYVAAMIFFFAFRHVFGVGFSADALIAFTALPLAHVAYVSAKGTLQTASRTEDQQPDFLTTAAPFWALLIVQLFVSWMLR